MEEKSKAIQLIRFIWQNENTNSYVRINAALKNAMKLAISANLEFEETDFQEIFEKNRGDYWFGVNSNGKGFGEVFYSLAISVGNMSACRSYESFVGIKPFISKEGHRCHDGKMFFDSSRKYKVTGFDFEKETIALVSYERNDIHEKGKRKLHSFTNKEWLDFRKTIQEF